MSNEGLNNQTTGYNKKQVHILYPESASQQMNKDFPSYRNAAYQQMRPKWEIINDVYAGTLRMREKGKVYLPPFPMESESSYKLRLSVATLMNAYARTVDAMVGLVVGSGMTVENIPEDIDSHLINIDNAGTEFEVFARDTMRDAFDGHSVILVDMPQPDSPFTNHAEALKANLRPYWTRYRAHDIVNWRTTVINGERVLQQVVFKEATTEDFGDYGEKPVIHYRRWRLEKDSDGSYLASWAIFKEVKEGSQISYVEIASNLTHLTRIPAVAVYGNKTGFLESIPPLLDLALKNIEHYQIDSDYKKGLSIAGIAIPTVTTGSGSEEATAAFGWDQLYVLGIGDDFKFVEANGKALPNKVVALETIKREMGVLGLSLIAERADANITATERLLDSVQQSNQLMAIQASLLQALRQALLFHAEWLKKKPEVEKVSVSLGLDWTELVRSADHLQLLLEMAKNDKLSTETLLLSAKKYGVLPSFIDPVEEIKRISEELKTRASSVSMVANKHGVQVHKDGSIASVQSTDDPQVRVPGVEKAEKDKAVVNLSTSLDKKEK